MPSLDELFPVKPMDPDAEAQPIEWLLPGLIMRGKINGAFGFEKAGKSRLLGWLLAHSYTEQSTFLGPSQSLGKTLYMLGEETAEDVTERLRHACSISGLDFESVPWSERVLFMPAAGLRLELPKQRQWLEGLLREHSIESLVIDPLRRVYGGKESSNDEISKLLNDLRRWTGALGLTVLLIHHTGKLSPDDDETRIATWSRGATDLPAILDWAFYVKRFKTPGLGNDRVMVYRTGRGPKMHTLQLVDYGEKAPGWGVGGSSG